MDYQKIFYALEISTADTRRERFHAHLKKHFKCPVWITKDNHYIPMDLMRESHLRNSLNMVTRNITTLHATATPLTFAENKARAEREFYHWRCLVVAHCRRKLPVSDALMMGIHEIMTRGWDEIIREFEEGL